MSSAASRRSRSIATRLWIAPGVLHGTLQLPGGDGPFPLALIVAGSGPVDRNGNAPQTGLNTDCYMQLAQYLADHGIASLRYDKRGAGKAILLGMPEAELSFDTYVGDALGWATKLRNDARFSTLTIIGHSEGSLIGMLVAREVSADGFVSIAGAGQRVDRVILEQLKPRLSPTLFRSSKRIVEKLSSGKTARRIPRSLWSVFRPTVQPFWTSWMRYDPATEIAGLGVPVLILHGGRDLQIPPRDARVLQRGLQRARVMVLPRMNHVMKDVKGTLRDNIKAYGDPRLPIDPKMAAAIRQFVRRVERKPRASRHVRRTR